MSLRLNQILGGADIRSPIFYDSNDTTYYIDAASTSNLVGLTVTNTITGSVSGNAGTATVLQTARNINGTSFNGSAAITTATWGTARTLTIGSTGKSVDGSAGVSWSLAEIGAAATNQTMFIGTTSVAINRSSASQTLTGISIDGNAATVTNGVYTTGAQTIGGTKTFSDGIIVNGATYYTFNKPSTTNYQTVALFGSASAGLFLTTDSAIIGVGAYYNNGWIATATSGRQIDFAGGNFTFGAFSGATVGGAASWGTVAQLSSAGVFSATGDFRAPIFYDSNNTALYCDPNGTSLFTGLTVTNTITGSISGNAGTVTNGVYTTGNQSIAGNKTFTGITSFTNASDYQISLNGSGTTWAGIEWVDTNGTDYMWYNGQNKTFAIGGGGSNISGKKLHVDGGVTIGADYDSTVVPANGLSIQGAIQIGDYYIFPINSLSSSATQARTFEIARIGIDFNDWNGIGTFEVELHEQYYSRGLKKVYNIWYGYTSNSGIRLVEWRGSGDNNFQCRIGSQVLVSGDQYYLPVYVDVRNYGIVDVVVKTNRTITTNTTPAIGYTYINTAPTATNITDFTADSDLEISTLGTAKLGGNTILTSSNYSGYSAFSGSVTSAYGNFASPGLIMGDAQYGFYVVSGNVYYKSASGGVHYWRNIANSANTMSLDNSGSLNLAADVRAPIFYDSNNTAYYVDAASTSVFNAFTGSHSGGSVNVTSVNGAYLGVNNTTNTNGYGISLYNGASAGEATYGLMFQGTATFGTHGSVTGDWATYFTMNNDNTRGWIFRKTGGGGNTASISAGGIITASSDVRAPIFYDSGDTTYYVDPAGTSRVSTLYVAGTLADSASLNGRIILSGNLHIDAYGGYDIYCNYYSGRRFRTYKGVGTGAETFRADTDGVVYAFEQFRSPIFYDSANTAYYLDPASTSNLNNLTVAGTMTFGTLAYVTESRRSKNSSNVDIETVTGLVSPSGPTFLEIRGFCPPAMFRTTGDRPAPYGLGFGNGAESGGIMPIGAGDNLQEIMLYGSNTGPTTFTFKRQNWEGSTYDPSNSNSYSASVFSINTGTGVVTASTDIRAPIFYDSNDTTYYTDPSSLSNILELKTNKNWYDSSASAWGGGINMGGNNPSIGFQSTASTWWYMLHHSTNDINFYRRSTSGGWNQDAIWHDSGYLEWITDSVRAAIFYDRSNTSYYCDPASTSNLVGLTVANTITGSVSGSSASCTGNAGTATTLATARTLTIGSTGKTFNGGADVSWSTTEIVGYTPAYGTAAYQTKSLDTITTPGLYQYDGAFGGTKPPDNSPNYRTIEIGSSARFSQIAMPWNSDGYYFRRYDGTSFSTWRTVLHDGNYNSYAPTLTGTGASGSWGISVTGSSASCTGNSATTTLATKATRANGDFFIDDNYGNTVVGLYSANRLQGVFAMGNSYKLTADGTGVGTLYGLAWSHPNFGGVAANLADHGLLILQNGVFKGAWGGGSLRTPGDVRGTLFYDWDNTTYYCDPASTSNLNAITAAGNITAAQYYTGGWFRNSGSGNGLYNESTGEHFYSDAADMWNVASANNTQGIRLRTGGHNGTIRGYFYANNSNDVGFLNNAGSWRLRIVGGDYALFDGSSIRAPIFYDSNDTNYYCDPNGTSSLAAVNANAYYPHGGITESDIYARSLSINAYHHGDSLTYDTFQFNAASVYETRATVGASFVSGTVETSIFRGDRFGGMTIANNVYQVRWTWNGTIGYRFFKTLYISNSTNGNSFTVTIESSANGSTWTTIATTGAMSNWPGHSWYNYFWNNNATIGYIRITVTPTWVNANSMDIYSMRYFCSYALDAGARLYDWDYNRNVTFPAFIDATQFRDTNNTAYYIDAASTSNLVGLTVANTITGSITGNAGGSSASCTGNAATATILQTARNINGTSFNGSAAITTATWGTARTLTIGSTGKSVDGSANVSWSLAELGAAATNQTMFIGTTSVAINRASASQTLTGISIDGSSTSCSGNAATATTTDNINGRAFSNRDSGNGVGQDAYTNNGVGYVTGVSLFSQTDGGIHASAYSASWVHQIYGDFRTGQIAIRGRNNGTWQAWRAVLDDTNYTTYTVTKTGTGASGSWGISVTGSSASCTGNAATVTNGVYTNASNTLTGVNYFQSNLGTTSGTLNTPPLQAYATGTNAAFMSFHRAGNYAVNMGLDSDNVLRIGGWSASANRLQLDMSGNLTLAGVVDATQFRDSANTAYYVDPASTSILNLVRTRNTFGERIALNSASPQTIDTQYNVTELTLTSSISTLTFSNIQASGIVHMWTLVTVGNATVYTITWPAAVKWPGGTAPTLTTTSGKRDIYQFVTYDGGTNIYAIIVGQNL